MKQKSSSKTARMSEEYYCKDCGWPIVDAVCTDEFDNFKDAQDWDWWFYCSNKGCKNHNGSGIFQAYPDWVAAVGT